MLKETEKLIEVLKNDYNIGYDSIKEMDAINTDYIKIGENSYAVLKGMDDEKILELAMYINAEAPDNVHEGVVTNVGDVVSEKLDDIEEDKIYKYVPEYVDEDETQLTEIAKLVPYCKVVGKLIVSKEDNEGLIEVAFDIDENADIELPKFVKDKTYLVFDSDLKETDKVVEKEEVAEDFEEVLVEQPVVDEEYNIEATTAVLNALNSEKEAIATYEFLINNSTDPEDIELFKKILKDENEHIALLAALQTKKVASDVGENHKEQLDDFATEVIETPASEE